MNSSKSNTKLNTKLNTKSNTPNKTKTKNLVFILIAIFLLGALVTSFIFINVKIRPQKIIASTAADYQEINTSVTVVNGTLGGFNTDTESLTFGKVAKGNGAFRYFDVSYPNTVRVKIVIEGDMRNFLRFDPSEFVIEGNQVQKVTASINIPSNAQEGNYSDVIKLYFYNN